MIEKIMIEKLKIHFGKHRLFGVISKIIKKTYFLKKYYYVLKYKDALVYTNPTDSELQEIEVELQSLGVNIYPLYVDKDDYLKFKSVCIFPPDYYGGEKLDGIREEKLLEHYISYKLLGLNNVKGSQYYYIDIAAHDSPWVKILRDVNKERIFSYAIDLNIPAKFAGYDYYIQMDATKTTFNDNSIDGISLQCAYEMFIKDSDINLIRELKRILKPGGKAIILPLYMHTHACHYTSPEFFGKGFGDSDSKEYIRWDIWGIKASRKYDAYKLKNRILDLISSLGMKYKIYVLKNKHEIHEGIYLHFILEVEK